MDFGEILGINQLNLSYNTRVEDFDGENFTYSIYFDDGASEEKKTEVDSAVEGFLSKHSNDYMGYIDVSVVEGKIFIYHDLGGVEPENNNLAIQELLKALDDVTGIKEVIINEMEL